MCCTGGTGEEIINLEDVDPQDIKVFNLKDEIYDCLVDPDDVYDGDTLKVVFIRKNEPMKITVRMHGIDTPELRPRKNIPERHIEIQKAQEARDALKLYIAGKKLRVRFLGNDKYRGRVIGILYISSEETSVNQWMIDNNYAKKYAGDKKTKWKF